MKLCKRFLLLMHKIQFQGKQGVVRQVYRGIIFLYAEGEEENGGYLCCKSQSCEKVKLFTEESNDKVRDSPVPAIDRSSYSNDVLFSLRLVDLTLLLLEILHPLLNRHYLLKKSGSSSPRRNTLTVCILLFGELLLPSFY